MWLRRKFKTVRQRDAMQCGAACLTMVCRHFGGNEPLEEVSRICHPTVEGVSLKGIGDSAEALGLEYSCGKITVDGLRECPLPAILHWNQNHFVVLHKISRNGKRFHIADPGKGRCVYSRREFEEHWLSTNSHGKEKGIALLLQPTEKFCRNTASRKMRNALSASFSVT